MKQHAFLSLLVAAATVFTIMVIYAGYAQIIELFPSGGGDYLVASKLLSSRVGVVSGSALIVDYVLNIAISVASGADSLFSLTPPHWLYWKLMFAAGGAGALTVLNLRGVRESVFVCLPVLMVFVLTHGFGMAYAVCAHAGDLPVITRGLMNDASRTSSETASLVYWSWSCGRTAWGRALTPALKP